MLDGFEVLIGLRPDWSPRVPEFPRVRLRDLEWRCAAECVNCGVPFMTDKSFQTSCSEGCRRRAQDRASRRAAR